MRTSGRGILISLSGIDGAGKTSVAKAAAEALTRRGHTVAVRKLRLFGNPAFKYYRKVLRVIGAESTGAELAGRSSLILLESARFALEEIAPLLHTSDVVICDRYLESARCLLRAGDMSTELFDIVARRFPKADLSFHLRIPVEIAVLRRIRLGEEVGDPEAQLLGRMAELLLATAVSEDGEVLDASRPIPRIAERISAAVCPMLRDRRLRAGERRGGRPSS